MHYGTSPVAFRFTPYSTSKTIYLFAGDVHDSQIYDQSTFEREENALIKSLNDHSQFLFVYISSCSILDVDANQTPYVLHKLKMEKIIKEKAERFLIFRLPQLLGMNMPRTNIAFYIADAIIENKTFDLWVGASRNFIDIDDAFFLVEKYLNSDLPRNRVVNIANKISYPMREFVQSLELFLGRPAQFNEIQRSSNYEIDVSEILPLMDPGQFDVPANIYLQICFNKYFSGYLGQTSKLLSVVVPTYNEEAGINEFYKRTKSVVDGLSPRFRYEIVFVNDSSTDNTLLELFKLSDIDKNVKVINFSRNFGNQTAIAAGLDHISGDIAVIIDDDLQDPPEIILNMIAFWDRGYKVVYGVRPVREGVNFLFKLIASAYYRVLGGLSEIKIPNDAGDFRLIDKAVIDKLKMIKEGNRYYRGIVSWIGFSQIPCLYERDRRFAGQSTFSFNKYVKFAFVGITSFTEKPLYFTAMGGLFVTIVGFLLAVALVAAKILDPSVTIRGWTSLIVAIVFFGGVQLLSIGIIGVYVGKIYSEVKGRPLYLIETTRNLF